MHMAAKGLQDYMQTNMHITNYDVSTQELTQQAIEKMVQANTRIIIGPLFSQTTEQVVPLAQDFGTVIMSLSNNPALATDGVYVFGHAPMKQTQRLLGYLLNENYRNYLVALPATRTSNNLYKIVEDMIRAGHGRVVTREFYAHKPESVNLIAEKLNRAVEVINENPQEHNKPVIFLQDEPKNLNLLLAALKKYNLDKKAIICADSRIDEVSSGLEVVFTGSLLIDHKRIRDTFRKHFPGQNIPHLAAIAYDVGAITAIAVGQKFERQNFLDILNSGQWFEGVSGAIRLNDNIAQRKYDIIMQSISARQTLDKGL